MYISCLIWLARDMKCFPAERSTALLGISIGALRVTGALGLRVRPSLETPLTSLKHGLQEMVQV